MANTRMGYKAAHNTGGNYDCSLKADGVSESALHKPLLRLLQFYYFIVTLNCSEVRVFPGKRLTRGLSSRTEPFHFYALINL